jgi:uncharacterized membrane protein
MNRTVLYVALFASLALNLFIAGTYVGSRLAGGHADASDVQRPRNPVVMAVRELTPEQRAAWRAQNRDFVAINGVKLREARRLTRETMLSFGAPSFDPARAIADLDRARALEHEARNAMDRRIVGFVATLPPADRARFGEALARPAAQRRQPVTSASPG